MADYGAGIGGGCANLCVGIFQQFFNTRNWGTNWGCMDSCCRCDCCWDNGEFDPADQPNNQGASGQDPKAENAATTRAEGVEGGDAPPPSYNAAEPMTVSKPAEEGGAAVANPAPATTTSTTN